MICNLCIKKCSINGVLPVDCPLGFAANTKEAVATDKQHAKVDNNHPFLCGCEECGGAG